MGIPKIKAEALKVRAEIMLAQGETEYAGRLAARSVGIANRNGMRLRKLSALLVYGRVLSARGQGNLAHDIYEDAAREANKLGYYLKANRAGSLLRDIV